MAKKVSIIILMYLTNAIRWFTDTPNPSIVKDLTVSMEEKMQKTVEEKKRRRLIDPLKTPIPWIIVGKPWAFSFNLWEHTNQA